MLVKIQDQYLLEAVSEGDPEKAVRALRSPMRGKEGPMGFNALRQAKNSAIINATLACRAAIRGGVRVENAYTLADYFILRSELCKTEAEALTLREEISYRFAQYVREQKKESQNYSNLVRRVLEEIERSVFVKVSRDDIVKAVNRNSDYVQRVFQKEVGHSITDHLRKERIKVASELIRSASVNLSDISELLHFSSTSHFARVFKQIMGISPSEYKIRSHELVYLPK